MRLVRLVSIALLFVLVAITANAEEHRFVIFHTSDVHGQIASRPARWHKPNPKRKVGGYAALKKLVDTEKLPYILIDTGDIFQGTPEGNLTAGTASFDAMNAVGYHAAVIGNHDYDYGAGNLLRLTRVAKFPMLAANIVRKRDGKPIQYARPTHTMQVGKLKVGLVGVATHETVWSTLPKNVAHLEFTDEVAAVKKHAEALRKDGAQVVVALTHCGFAPSMARKRVHAKDLVLTDDDKKYVGDLLIARGAPVDLVFGGHTHTGLEEPYIDARSGVALINSFEGLVAVSRVVVTYDDQKKKVVQVEGKLTDLWVDEYGEDAEVLKLVEKVRAKVGAELDKQIGTLSADMKRVEGGLDSPLGNWVTDVVREAFQTDFGIQNTYGLRADLFGGGVRIRDVYEVMPFENTVAILEMTGAQIEDAVSSMLHGKKSKIQISGLIVRFRLSAGGEKAVDVQVLTSAGAALDPKRVYTVATNNYVVSAYEPFRSLKSRDTARSLRETIIDAIRERTPVTPPRTGRFEMLDALPGLPRPRP